MVPVRGLVVAFWPGHSNGRYAEVLDGLAEGDSVILYPGDRIADGVRILSRGSR